MSILDKNNQPVQEGLYQGEGSNLYGPIYLAQITHVGPDHVDIRSIHGYGIGNPRQVAQLERIKDPLKFSEWLESQYSPSSMIVHFMKSLLWDLAKERIPKPQLREAVNISSTEEGQLEVTIAETSR